MGCNRAMDNALDQNEIDWLKAAMHLCAVSLSAPIDLHLYSEKGMNTAIASNQSGAVMLQDAKNLGADFQTLSTAWRLLCTMDLDSASVLNLVVVEKWVVPIYLIVLIQQV